MRRLAITLALLALGAIALSSCEGFTVTSATTSTAPPPISRPLFHHVPPGLQTTLIEYLSRGSYTRSFPGKLVLSARQDLKSPAWWEFTGQGRGKYARTIVRATGIVEHAGSRWSVVSAPSDEGCVNDDVPVWVASYFGLKTC